MTIETCKEIRALPPHPPPGTETSATHPLGVAQRNLVELRQIILYRAIRADSVSVNSTLPLSWTLEGVHAKAYRWGSGYDCILRISGAIGSVVHVEGKEHAVNSLCRDLWHAKSLGNCVWDMDSQGSANSGAKADHGGNPYKAEVHAHIKETGRTKSPHPVRIMCIKHVRLLHEVN